MYTSYYTGYFNTVGLPTYFHPVSISVSMPKVYNNCVEMIYKPLIPQWSMVKDFREKRLSETTYRERYFSLLDFRDLTPAKVSADLGDCAVLLCWENPKLFCHRHIVSKWMREAGFDCVELDLSQYLILK